MLRGVLVFLPQLHHSTHRVVSLVDGFRSKWSIAFIACLQLHKCCACLHVHRCRTTGEYVVLKVYRLADQCDLQRVQLYREIRVHSRLQHQNIVQFYAAFLVRHNLITG
jgi:aurora kinase